MKEPLSRASPRSTGSASVLYPSEAALLEGGPGHPVTEGEGLTLAQLEALGNDDLKRMHDDIHRIMDRRSIDMKAHWRALRAAGKI